MKGDGNINSRLLIMMFMVLSVLDDAFVFCSH